MLDKFSKVILKARQLAKRTRTAVACPRCKSAKQKCSDDRPCKQCTFSKSDCTARPAKLDNRMTTNDVIGPGYRHQLYDTNLSDAKYTNNLDSSTLSAHSNVPLALLQHSSFDQGACRPVYEGVHRKVNHETLSAQAGLLECYSAVPPISMANTSVLLPQAVEALLSRSWLPSADSVGTDLRPAGRAPDWLQRTNEASLGGSALPRLLPCSDALGVLLALRRNFLASNPKAPPLL